MIHVITATGILLVVAGLLGLGRPGLVREAAARFAASRQLRLAAATARIVLGALAIVTAGETPYPLVMKILGVVAIMAGTLLTIAGTSASAWSGADDGRCRILALAALAMGAFLTHAGG